MAKLMSKSELIEKVADQHSLAKKDVKNVIEWVAALLARRPTKVAAIALANKLARMAWAMMSTGEPYNYPAALRV